MKRLGIFFFYDRDGIADRYIDVLLKDFCENIDRLLVVVNGKLSDPARKFFLQYADEKDLLVRENKGFDVWAYKTGIEHVGYDRLGDYDEMIMFNHTIMGPVIPFREMFSAMDRQDVDFWGITKFLKTEDDPFGTMPGGFIPEHIQSHFIAVRKKLLASEDFKKYWTEMPMITNYIDSVTRHESRFTPYFDKLGYTWTTYVDESSYEGITYNPVLTFSRDMIEKQGCPIFKRRAFMQDYTSVLNESAGENALLLTDYLETQTDYDMDLVWDNLLRLENLADLKKNMHWNYFLPADYTRPAEEGKKRPRTALFMHIYFADCIDQCRDYASAMPSDADFYITTSSEETAEKIREAFSTVPCKNLFVKVYANCGRDVGPFLLEVQDHLDDYDIVCHAHDKKAGQVKPGSIGLSFAYKCFENVLGSREYVENILDTFSRNKRLGMLMPPPPNHADYYITLGMEWGLNYGNTEDLLHELDLHAPIHPLKEPIAALGSYFWIRTDALRPLFRKKKWKAEDFPKEPIADDGTLLHAIERIYPFAAQDAGFYSGWVMTQRGAAMEVTNQNFMLHELNKIIFYHGGDAGNFNYVRLGLSNAYSVANHHRWQRKNLRYLQILKSGPVNSVRALKRHWRRKHGKQ